MTNFDVTVNSSTNFSVTVNNGVAGGIGKSLATAKGDILAAVAANSFGVLGLGTQGQALTVDTTTASGLAWSNAGAGDVTKALITGKGQIYAGAGNGTITALAAGSQTAFLTADSSTASGMAWITSIPASNLPSIAALTGYSVPLKESLPIVTSTNTTYQLTTSVLGGVLELNNASAITLTIPPSATVAFSIGAQFCLVQLGAGAITVASGAAVTINANGGSVVTNGQYAAASLYKRAADTWNLFGDLT